MNRKSFGVGMREISEELVMKECPICRELCFDDMEICFGCLHRFSSDEEVLRFREGEEKKVRNNKAKSSLEDSTPVKNSPVKNSLPEISTEKQSDNESENEGEDKSSNKNEDQNLRKMICNGFEIVVQIKPL
ncbi:MAG: hypothetical protein ACI4BI_02920 [Anaerotardibacter sp.]